MRVTIKDVAKKAGVATSTVSRTLKDEKSISQATKDKVRKAMKELGYVPNFSAQNLANKLVKNVGLVLPHIVADSHMGQPFFMDLISNISQELTNEGYMATIVTYHNLDDLITNIQNIYQQKRVDAFVLLYSISNDPVLEYLVENKIPVVVIGHPVGYENQVSYVDNDNVLVGKTATEYLLNNGHTKIGIVASNDQELVYQERYQGYQEVMKQNDLPVFSNLYLNKEEDVFQLVELLEQRVITSLVVCDDMTAIKLNPLFNDCGLKLGDSLSTISVNNSIFSTLLHPYLTTIDINVDCLAKKGAEVILDILNNKQSVPTSSLVSHEVVCRETVRKINK